jgi:signal transduction histidine kinase
MLVFDEIKDYMGFSLEDARLLVDAKACVQPSFEHIVSQFYRSLNDNPRTKGVFEGPEQVERLHGSLLKWLDELFCGVYDDAYFHRRMRIGRAHVAVGLLPHYMFGAMNIVRTEIEQILWFCDDLPDRAYPHMRAMHRLLDIELTIMLQSYWDNMMELKLKVPAALASGLAHEIRNPLNALALNVTLLERKVRARDGGENGSGPIMDAMRSEIRRITNLTTEIMDFAKPIEVYPGWVDAHSVTDAMRITLGPTMEASGIQFATTVEGPSMIWVDFDRIKQALMNLLSNAIEACGKDAEITLLIRSGRKGTDIVVRDSGEGMPTGMQYRIFDLFFTSKTTGTGLGLPIVKKIVEAHEGTIDVNSKAGRGTEFLISIPRPVHEHDET